MKIIQPQPPGFQDQIYEFSFEIEADEIHVWNCLNDPRTFTETQVWPYIVEFYSPDPEKIENGFNEGVLTNHYGPFVNFAGELVKIVPNSYRDLQYYYGSYAINFNWIRPYRLEFSTESEDGVTKITGRIGCYVKPWIASFWLKMQKRFWKRFQNWIRKRIKRNRRV